MPTAREALLNATLSALTALPWSAVRMVDVASAAGVSRQTLYNEFGSKDGLARALVRREADLYLNGVEQRLSEPADAVDRLVSVAEWTVAEARARPLLRALLTGGWTERHPAPRPVPPAAPPGGAPAQRRADAGLLEPADMVVAVRNRAVAALDPGRAERRARTDQLRTEQARLEPGRGRQHRRGERPRHEPHRSERGRAAPLRTPDTESAELAFRCELTVRLALAHVVAPDGEPVGRLVRAAVTAPVSGMTGAVSGRPSPKAGGR